MTKTELAVKIRECQDLLGLKKISDNKVNETRAVDLETMLTELERQVEVQLDPDPPKAEKPAKQAAVSDAAGKVCKNCGDLLPNEMFGKDSKMKDGRSSICGTRKTGCLKKYYDEKASGGPKQPKAKKEPKVKKTKTSELVDLMAALEESVQAAKEARISGLDPAEKDFIESLGQDS